MGGGERFVHKFLVVDDHSMVRSGLRAVLHDLAGEESIILEAGSLEEALAVIDDNQNLSLVLLDMKLPDCEGLEGLKSIKETTPEVKVALISGSEDWELAISAFQLGAVGFIPKAYNEIITMNALRLILSGGVFLPSQVFERQRVALTSNNIQPTSKVSIIEEATGRTTRNGAKEHIVMAPRQLDILNLMLAGQSNKEIARSLGLALGTVKNQVAVILRVLNANNRSQAIMNAIKIGIAGESLAALPPTPGRREF